MNVCSSCGLAPHKDGACPDELKAVREVSEAAVKALAAERAEISSLKEEVASLQQQLSASKAFAWQRDDAIEEAVKEREKAEKYREALNDIPMCHEDGCEKPRGHLFGHGPWMHADTMREAVR